MIAAILMSLTAGVALADPGIDPNTVERLIFPGESSVVGKAVTTPAIPPTPDIYFLADTTGSMGSAIANVKANAAAVLADIASQTTDPLFGAGDYKDFPYDSYAFLNAAPITNDGGAAALAAIAGWAASGGFDGSEGQFYALDRIADGVVNWRPNSTRIVVWFGDAPAHDPVCSAISGLGYDISEASLTAKLVAAEIRVIAISTLTGFPSGLNDDPQLSAGDYNPPCAIGGSAGQANRIAAATGGVSLTNVPPDQVSAAILQGLANLPAEVAMESTCVAPISTSFAPASQTVTSGDVANFVETISVAAGAAGGTYTCYDWATVNGEDMVNAAGDLITEDKTIHVPGIDLQPETDTNELGFDLSHQVMATVSAGDYGPVEGVLVTFEVTAGPNAGPTGSDVTDVAGEAFFSYTPAVAPASLGTDTIVACFTNADGTVVYGCDTAEKTWQDTTPPVAACVPTTNPAGLNEPNAPGNGGQGQNQDGYYRVSAVDVVWPADALEIFVTDSGSGTVFGPFPVDTKIKYVQAPGGTPSIRLMGGNAGHEPYWLIKGRGDALVTGVDGSGNVSDPVSCLVPPPPQ
jgi:hypothetical protein